MAAAEGGFREDRSEASWRMETLGNITAGVVHDFNNILAAISGYAELIVSGHAQMGGIPAFSQAEEFARNILQAAVTGQMAIRELQDFSKKKEMTPEPLDIHEVLKQSSDIVRGALGGGIFVTTDFCPHTRAVMGYRTQWQNAFINLLLNARDAMPRGGCIRIATELHFQEPAAGGPAGETMVVSIRDSGVGMTEETMRRVFEPYFTTKGEKGSGLGLANVSDTVKRHGGRIDIHSEPGVGSEFTVSLPCARSASA